MHVFSDISIREKWAVPLASIIGTKGLKGIISYCDTFSQLTQNDYKYQFSTKQPNNLNRLKLDKAITDLKLTTTISHLLIEKFKSHILEGSDKQVIRMRPFALADKWNLDRMETLRLFLYATNKGLLELNWELMCPNCRIPKAEYNSLKMLSSKFHCDWCGISYEADLDQYTELRFSINQEIRSAEDNLYCIGNPSNTPHILAQQYIKAGEERDLLVCLPDESLRIRTLRYNQTAILHPAGITTSNEITFTNTGCYLKQATFKPGKTKIRLCNKSKEIIAMVVEQIKWSRQGVSAATVTTMQEFRNLFSSEVLSPGKQIGIRNLCVLFTDLKKSSQLYELIGDTRAYGQVTKHFDFLTEIIQQNHGSIVKTIGDAVMAVFHKKINAMRAGMEIQCGINEFNKKYKITPSIIIKLGIHYGSAIAVNANDCLDYFGRTVNIASRIQKESQGNDIIISQEVFNEPDIQNVLKDFTYDFSSFETRLKDIEGRFKLCRIMPKQFSKKQVLDKVEITS